MKQHSIRHWITRWFIAILFLSMVISAVANLYEAYSSTMQSGREWASLCAYDMRNLLDHQWSLEELSGSAESEEYMNARRITQNLCRNYEMDYIYVYTVDPEKAVRYYYLCVSNDPEKDCELQEYALSEGDRVDLMPGEKAILAGSDEMQEEVLHNWFGNEVTWIVPYYDTEGVLRAMIGMDYSLTRLRQEILECFRSQFVGLEDIQDWIEEQADLVEERMILGEPVVTMPVKGLVLSANPGAGKTTAVRFLADAMFRLNLLSSKEPLILSGSQLLNKYVNATQEDTHRMIRQAREENRLLVIDEAHQLLSESEHFASNTGKEAIQAFMAPLTEITHPLRVIFIVYLSREEQFLNADPGMRERVRVIRIPDYDGPTLFRIFEKIAQRPENAGRTLEQGLLEAVRAYCDVFYAGRTPTSGNARKMESLYSEICSIHRRRCRRQGIDAKNDLYWVLTEEDLPDEVREAIS